jgi:hypothetical protein
MVRFGEPDGLVFALPDTSPAFPIISHEDVKNDIWAGLWLAPLIFLPLVVLRA